MYRRGQRTPFFGKAIEGVHGEFQLDDEDEIRRRRRKQASRKTTKASKTKEDDEDERRKSCKLNYKTLKRFYKV